MIKENEIKSIAYGIWQQEGCQDGRDCEHWLRAEVIWEEKQKREDAAKDIKAESKQPIKQNPKYKTAKSNPQTGRSIRS